MNAKKIIFITGTDTGVGKTLLTALLLQHLRGTGIRALAMKPFCSGGLGDVRLLQSLQPGELTDAEINPFYFSQPIAPLIAAKKKSPIRLGEVVKRITQIQKKCDCLLIEGSGGLMVPLGQGFTVADLIAGLDCQVIVTARNRLGTINHTLLTINALRAVGLTQNQLSIVLMSPKNRDLSSRTNLEVISNLVSPIPVFAIPFLGSTANTAKNVRKHCLNNRLAISRIINAKTQF